MARNAPRMAHRTVVAAVLLATLLLRALIPAGFMPAAGAGSLALVFCGPATPGGTGAHAHHQPHDDGTGGRDRSVAGECPFAQSAAPALPAVAALIHAPPRLAALVAARRAEPVHPAVPPRHTGARGPPSTC